jgi:hypothetical protein
MLIAIGYDYLIKIALLCSKNGTGGGAEKRIKQEWLGHKFLIWTKN